MRMAMLSPPPRPARLPTLGRTPIWAGLPLQRGRPCVLQDAPQSEQTTRAEMDSVSRLQHTSDQYEPSLHITLNTGDVRKSPRTRTVTRPCNGSTAHAQSTRRVARREYQVYGEGHRLIKAHSRTRCFLCFGTIMVTLGALGR